MSDPEVQDPAGRPDADEADLVAVVERVSEENRKLRAALADAHERLERVERDAAQARDEARIEMGALRRRVRRARGALSQERERNAWLRASLPVRLYARLRRLGRAGERATEAEAGGGEAR